MTLRRLLAPNPGIYTGPGTNTYVLEDSGEAVVLDPGPVIAEHMVEIVEALGGLRPVGVVVTHTHPDHAPMANPLAKRLDVPAYGHDDGPSFMADVRVRDGDVVRFGSAEMTAVHTPGHTPDHLCFLDADRLFTGDHIMGGSTVVIEDATAYMESLYRVRDLNAARIEPGHGPALDRAGSVIDEYIDHRLKREKQLLDAIAAGVSTPDGLVDLVYDAVPEALRRAARHQVVVQLVKLSDEGRVRFRTGETGPSETVELVEGP